MKPILSTFVLFGNHDGTAAVGGGGGGLISVLLMALIMGIVILAIWWVGTWFIARLGAPAIVRTLWDGLFILVGLIIVINFLLGLTGHGFIAYS